jgi:hypothetical protein
VDGLLLELLKYLKGFDLFQDCVLMLDVHPLLRRGCIHALVHGLVLHFEIVIKNITNREIEERSFTQTKAVNLRGMGQGEGKQGG